MTYSHAAECQKVLQGLAVGDSKECRHDNRGFGPVIVEVVCIGATLSPYKLAESTAPYPGELIVEREMPDTVSQAG